MALPRRCTGAIIAGGGSTRFGGSPKGLARVGGVRLIDRVAAALAEACDALMLVANDERATEWLPGITPIRDIRPGAGALGGVHAALAMADGDVIAVSCDMPFVPGALLRALRDAGELADADAAVPRSGSPWGFEPVCAWYASSCIPAIARQLDAGDYRAGVWQSTVNTLHVDVASFGDPSLLFFNVNTAEDLVRAERLVKTTTGS